MVIKDWLRENDYNNKPDIVELHLTVCMKCVYASFTTEEILLIPDVILQINLLSNQLLKCCCFTFEEKNDGFFLVSSTSGKKNCDLILLFMEIIIAVISSETLF